MIEHVRRSLSARRQPRWASVAGGPSPSRGAGPPVPSSGLVRWHSFRLSRAIHSRRRRRRPSETPSPAAGPPGPGRGQIAESDRQRTDRRRLAGNTPGQGTQRRTVTAPPGVGAPPSPEDQPRDSDGPGPRAAAAPAAGGVTVRRGVGE